MGGRMRIFKSILGSIALISVVTACSNTSQEIQVAPQSQEQTGVIIQGSGPEVNAVLRQSSEYRVLSAAHGLYEVKGLSLNEVKALGPHLSAEKNKYLEKVVSSHRKYPVLEKAFQKLASDENETEEEEVPTPAVPDLPPALQGCDLSIQEKPTVVLGISNEVLSESLTMNFSETPGFTGVESTPHPSNPDSPLELRWEVLPPSLSSIPSEATVGETFEFTPDSVGHYRIVLVAKDNKNACECL